MHAKKPAFDLEVLTRILPQLACRYAEFQIVGNASVHLTGYYVLLPEHDQGVWPHMRMPYDMEPSVNAQTTYKQSFHDIP